MIPILVSAFQLGIAICGFTRMPSVPPELSFAYLDDGFGLSLKNSQAEVTAATFLQGSELFWPTFNTLVTNCDEVFEGRCVSVGDSDEHGLYPIQLVVAKVHKSRRELIRKDMSIQLLDLAPPRSGEQYLVVAHSRTSTSVARVLLPLDANTQRYLHTTCFPNQGKDEPKVSRLSSILPFFEDDNEFIARDALKEIASARHSEWLEADVSDLRTKIIQRLNHPDFQDIYVGVYAALLGEAGVLEDVSVLEGRIFPLAQYSKGMSRAGLMAGYLMLSGERGLVRLEQELRDTSTINVEERSVPMPFSELAAFLTAIDFVWHASIESLPKKRLNESVYPLLNRDIVADIAIEQVRRHRDWGCHRQVCAVYLESPDSPRITRLAVAKYLIQFREEMQQTAASPALVAADESLRLLDEITASDTKLFIDAKLRLKKEQD